MIGRGFICKIFAFKGRKPRRTEPAFVSTVINPPPITYIKARHNRWQAFVIYFYLPGSRRDVNADCDSVHITDRCPATPDSQQIASVITQQDVLHMCLKRPSSPQDEPGVSLIIDDSCMGPPVTLSLANVVGNQIIFRIKCK